MGKMGNLRILLLVFSILLLGLFGYSQEAFAADFGDAPFPPYGIASHTTCGPAFFGTTCGVDDGVIINGVSLLGESI